MPSHKNDGPQTAAEIVQLHRARPGNYSVVQLHKRRRLLMDSVASHGWKLFSSDWDQATNSLIGIEFNKFKLWQSALLAVVSCMVLICFQVAQSLGTIKVHPSARCLADAIGHALTQLDPSSAHLLKAGSICKQKASGKDMASANCNKHQGSCSSKPVGAESLDEEEEPFFELNQLVYN